MDTFLAAMMANSIYGKYAMGTRPTPCGYCLGCGVNLPRGCPNCFRRGIMYVDTDSIFSDDPDLFPRALSGDMILPKVFQRVTKRLR